MTRNPLILDTDGGVDDAQALLMLLAPLPNPPPLRNPHRPPPTQPLQIPRPMPRSRMQRPPRWRLAVRNPTILIPTKSVEDSFIVRRRRHIAVLAQDALRGGHEELLVHVQDGAGRVVQEAFDESVVLGGEPGWLTVWAAGSWAWVSMHCWSFGWLDCV